MEMTQMVGKPDNLGHCSAEYAASLANPFDGPEGACIPDYPALMTGRDTVFAKGTFQTSNLTGWGWVIADPKFASANDANSVITNAPAAPGLIIDDTVPANIVTFQSNSPYTVAQLTPPSGPGSALLQRRVVSAGLRIRYTGSELNRGGRAVGLHDPAHQSLEGRGEAGILLFRESGQFEVTRRWTNLLYRPVDGEDLDFSDGFTGGGPNTYDRFYMGFVIQAPDPAIPMQFYFEFWVHLETQGRIVVNKIPSHVDVVGHGAVNAITNMATNLHKPHQENSGDLAGALVSAASHYVAGNVSNPAAKPQPSKPSIWQSILGLAPTLISGIASLF